MAAKEARASRELQPLEHVLNVQEKSGRNAQQIATTIRTHVMLLKSCIARCGSFIAQLHHGSENFGRYKAAGSQGLFNPNPTMSRNQDNTPRNLWKVQQQAFCYHLGHQTSLRRTLGLSLKWLISRWAKGRKKCTPDLRGRAAARGSQQYQEISLTGRNNF